MKRTNSKERVFEVMGKLDSTFKVKLNEENDAFNDAGDDNLSVTGTKATIVVMSHLSDIQMEITTDRELAKVRLNFIKYLINKLNGNLNVLINPDKLFDEYTKEQNT